MKLDMIETNAAREFKETPITMIMIFNFVQTNFQMHSSRITYRRGLLDSSVENPLDSDDLIRNTLPRNFDPWSPLLQPPCYVRS